MDWDFFLLSFWLFWDNWLGAPQVLMAIGQLTSLFLLGFVGVVVADVVTVVPVIIVATTRSRSRHSSC